MSGLFGGGDGVDIPAQTAGNTQRTAKPVEQLSEQARKNRRRKAGAIGRDIGQPKLSVPGLLGVLGDGVGGL